MRNSPVYVLVLLLLPYAAWSLCSPGLPGRDSVDFNITVKKDFKTGCTTQIFPNGLSPVVVCNGTNSAQCPAPTISTAGLPSGCGSVTGIGSATFCNGTAGGQGATGSAGLKGATGATGPLPVVTASSAANCQLISNGVVSITLCNGTSNVTGALGPQGLTGPQGTNGTNGATGARGATGYSGILPNYYVLDASSGFAYTRVGLNLALTTVSAAGGGVLYLAPCYGACTAGTDILQSDCSAPIVIPSGVTLDLGGNTIQMSPDNQACSPMIQLGSVTSPSSFTVNGMALVANSTLGSLTVTVAANSAQSSLLAVGQMCLISFGYIDSTANHAVPFINQLVRIAAFVNSTGVITLRKPLVANFGNFNTFPSTITCWVQPNSNIAIRNGYLSYGYNSNAASSLIQAPYGTGIQISRISVLGPSPVSSQSAIYLSSTVDTLLEEIVVDSISATPAVFLYSTSGIIARSFKFFNSGTGISITQSYYNQFSDVTVDKASTTGLILTTSAFNTFSNVVVNQATTRGIQMNSRSYRNIFHGVLTTACSGYGIEFSGTSDSYNQIYNLVARTNTAGPYYFGSGATGNYLDGDISGTPVNANPGVPSDPLYGNMMRQTLSSNGFVSLAVHNTTVSASDFATTRQLIINSPDDGTIMFNLKGSDGVVRSVKLSPS